MMKDNYSCPCSYSNNKQENKSLPRSSNARASSCIVPHANGVLSKKKKNQINDPRDHLP